MFKQLTVAFVLVLFVAGCSHQRAMQNSSDNPASPSAAEAPAPNTSQGITPGVSGPMGVGSTGSVNQEAVYTCPMHPQIVQPKPGNCPICGMTLVPKK